MTITAPVWLIVLLAAPLYFFAAIMACSVIGLLRSMYSTYKARPRPPEVKRSKTFRVIEGGQDE